MKKIFIILTLSLLHFLVNAQSIPNGTGINVGINIPNSSGNIDVINAINHIENPSFSNKDTLGIDTIYYTPNGFINQLWINYGDTLKDSLTVVINDTTFNKNIGIKTIQNVRKFSSVGDELKIYVASGVLIKTIKFYGYMCTSTIKTFSNIRQFSTPGSFNIFIFEYNGYSWIFKSVYVGLYSGSIPN